MEKHGLVIILITVDMLSFALPVSCFSVIQSKAIGLCFPFSLYQENEELVLFIVNSSWHPAWAERACVGTRGGAMHTGSDLLCFV